MKRLFSLFLIIPLILGLTVFPNANAVQEFTSGRELLADPAILEAVTAQYDAFAAAHYSPTAADDALDRFLEHGFYGKSKYLTLDESDPVLSAFLGSAMYRDFFLTCMTEALSNMQVTGTDRLLTGGRLSWETYSHSYHLSGYGWNETAVLTDDVEDAIIVGSCKYVKGTNRCDEALLLVVGGMDHRIRIREIRKDFDTVTYRLELRFTDSFSFDSDYSLADKKGFNTTFGKLLNILGPLMGLKPYGWHLDTTMEITLPNLCTHASESYRWENVDGTLVSISGNGYTSNPLSTLHKTDDGKTSLYFAMETPVVLSPDRDWIVEFSSDKWYNVFLYPSNYSTATTSPVLRKTWNQIYIGEMFYERVPTENGSLWHQWHDAYEVSVEGWQLPTSNTHTYRVENRIGEDGTVSIVLFVDGEEIGAFNRHFSYDHVDQLRQDLDADPNWAAGTELRLRYLYDILSPCPAENPIRYLEIREGTTERVSFAYSEGSCFAGTVETRTCSRCGATEQTEAAPPQGHTEEIIPGKAPTCTEPGLTEGARCTVCNEITRPQTAIPATGHTEEPVGGKLPTCTEPGLTEGARCTVCNEITRPQTAIPAIGHTEETVNGKLPTCTEPGLTEGARCTVCNKITLPQTTVPTAAHSYQDGLCSVCGQRDPSLIPGDANGDGIANYQDALLVLRHSISLETLSPRAILACDLNSSGDLTYQDALLILRISIGLT